MESASAPRCGRTCHAAHFLGRELFRLRLEQGISLRGLARLFGMSAHSGLVDYERGLRIPPVNIIQAYGRVFAGDQAYLLRLRKAAMVERAANLVAARETVSSAELSVS